MTDGAYGMAAIADRRALERTGPPVFDDRAPPLPLGADGQLDVIVDTDGTAVLFDPADNDAEITSQDGVVWLGDWE